jgi:Protein of unknown function (DUF2975)
MKTNPKTVLVVMEVFAGIALIGYAIEAGAKIISTIVSVKSSGAATNLYKGLNLGQLREDNFVYYIMAVSFLIAIPLIKAHIWYKVALIIHNFNLEKPFTAEMVRKFDSIVQDLFGIVITSLIANGWFEWLTKKYDYDFQFSHSIEEYIFMAALVFILIHVFKKGIEIQSENELTV